MAEILDKQLKTLDTWGLPPGIKEIFDKLVNENSSIDERREAFIEATIEYYKVSLNGD